MQPCDTRCQFPSLTAAHISAWQPLFSAWSTAQEVHPVGHICTHDTPHLPRSLGWPPYFRASYSQRFGQPSCSLGSSSGCTPWPREVVGPRSSFLPLAVCYARCSNCPCKPLCQTLLTYHTLLKFHILLTYYTFLTCHVHSALYWPLEYRQDVILLLLLAQALPQAG